jgi:hypothetical protein
LRSSQLSDLGIGHARVALRFRELLEVGIEVREEEDHEGQAECRQDHHADTA